MPFCFIIILSILGFLHASLIVYISKEILLTFGKLHAKLVFGEAGDVPIEWGSPTKRLAFTQLLCVLTMFILVPWDDSFWISMATNAYLIEITIVALYYYHCSEK